MSTLVRRTRRHITDRSRGARLQYNPCTRSFGIGPVVQGPPTPTRSILHLPENRLDPKLAAEGPDQLLVGPFLPVADQNGLAQMGFRDLVQRRGRDHLGQL